MSTFNFAVGGFLLLPLPFRLHPNHTVYMEYILCVGGSALAAPSTSEATVVLTSASFYVSSGSAVHRRAPLTAHAAHRRRETAPGFSQCPGKPHQHHEWLLSARAYF